MWGFSMSSMVLWSKILYLRRFSPELMSEALFWFYCWLLFCWLLFCWGVASRRPSSWRFSGGRDSISIFLSYLSEASGRSSVSSIPLKGTNLSPWVRLNGLALKADPCLLSWLGGFLLEMSSMHWSSLLWNPLTSALLADMAPASDGFFPLSNRSNAEPIFWLSRSLWTSSSWRILMGLASLEVCFFNLLYSESGWLLANLSAELSL